MAKPHNFPKTNEVIEAERYEQTIAEDPARWQPMLWS